MVAGVDPAAGARHCSTLERETAASPSGAAPQPRVVPTTSLGVRRTEHRAVYHHHPAIARYSTQDVAYPAARARGSCAHVRPGLGRDQASRTARVLAGAPLVYFFYEYGRAKGVAQATAVADSIYSYASTEIRGPSDARTLLDGVLQGWGLPVAAGSTASKPSTSPAAGALIASVRQAIGAVTPSG